MTDEQPIWPLCKNEGSWGDTRVVLEHDIFSVGWKVNNLLRIRQHDFSNRTLKSGKTSGS